MCLSTLAYESISGIGKGWKLAAEENGKYFTTGLGSYIEFDVWMDARVHPDIPGTEHDHGFHIYIRRSDPLDIFLRNSHGVPTLKLLPVFFCNILSIGFGDGRDAGRDIPIVVARRIYYPSSPFPDFPVIPPEYQK